MGYTKGIKWTYELVKGYVENLGYILISKEYKSNKNNLILKDESEYFYCISFASLLSNCIPNIVHISNPYTIQNIKLWLKINNKSFELISDKYISSKEKLQWRCLKVECREIFESTWNDIHSGCGCSFCSGMQIGLSNCLATKNPNLASEWHPTKNGSLTPFDVTCGNTKKVWWKCDKGHEWEANIASRNSGKGCSICKGQIPSNENNFLACSPKLCEEWNYEKNDKKPEKYTPHSGLPVWWICKDCGYEWETPIHERSKGNGCPQCRMSKGEKRIKEILDLYNIYYIPQKTFNGLIGLGYGNLSYDFYLPDYNLLIEYQGEMHERFVKGIHKSKNDFDKQVEHDKRKCNYAILNKIKLLEIWYYDYDNIDSIIFDYLNI